MLKKIVLGLFTAILLASCGGKEPRPFPVEIILDAPISDNGKYPTSLGNLLLPIDYNEDMFLIPKPIKMRRVDTGGSPVELNAFFFENTGEPTLELYQNWMPIYFKDSIPPKELLASKGGGESVKDYVARNADKQTFIVLANDHVEALEGKENVYFAEDEAAVSKKIIEILKADGGAKISLAFVKEAPLPIVNRSPEVAKFEEEKSASITHSSDWKELYKEATEHIHPKTFNDDVEHRAGHPESYSYLVEAAKMAIRSNQKEQLLMRLDFDVRNKEGLYKIQIGHEADWSVIKNALEAGDINKLDELMKFKLDLANEITQKNKGQKTGEDEHEHEH